MTGSGKELKLPIYKGLKINKKQHLNWDPKAIRKFLDGNHKATYEETYMIQIIREMFEKGVLKVYGDKLTEEYKNVLEMI